MRGERKEGVCGGGGGGVNVASKRRGRKLAALRERREG